MHDINLKELLRPLYVVKPYKVGSKVGNSTAMVIPADVVKECDINTYALLALRADAKTKDIRIRVLVDTAEVIEGTPTYKSSKASESRCVYDQEMNGHE